jgi:hypothetical protein
MMQFILRRPRALALAAAGTVVSVSDADWATGVRRVGLSTRHLVPVLVDWKLHEARVWALALDSDAARADASATHTRIAERLRDLALKQGGIYIKGGQHIWCATCCFSGDGTRPPAQVT